MSLYSFIRNAVGNLGVGVSDLGFTGSMAPPPEGIYDARRNVRGQLFVQAPAYAKLGQNVVSVSLVGNGLAMQGQLTLNPLAETEGN